ncbi:uncharacterized protein BYT42DRAFT_585453 [Radiomyces spectabilis]|uniref:uncharacterized protein n=1 Tax=Radiomyces spectabilis TaxID=64574 RepID=UPI00221EDD17|nr:uncharacterized protein BYT42DRAFT_585453 [Radiomyces spectabilis]KAI8368143.1 hypothetical protein BYT42DRAFT_585453 [Radiomyces spectabilis]
MSFTMPTLSISRWCVGLYLLSNIIHSTLAQGAPVVSSSCSDYPGGICSNYVDYSIFTGNVGVPMIENQLHVLTNISTLLGKIDEACVDAYYRYECSASYPRCEMSSSQEIKIWVGCTSACQDVHSNCKKVFQLLDRTDLLPNCDAVSPITQQPLQPDDSCNHIPPKVSDQHGDLNLSAVPEGFVLGSCPAPFLKDPLAKQGTTDTTNPTYCRFGCCVPCPAQELFYNEGWMVHGFLATDIVRFISAVASFVILVSYLVLPDKRRHPSLAILNLSLAIFLFSMTVFFSIGDPRRLQCAADHINPGQQDNNMLCAAQGAILIFASLATCTWCAALILNLHFHTVWNSSFFANRYYILYVVCWGIPTAVMVVALGMHVIKFEFANLCLVSVDQIFNLFFYPMAAVVCPAFLLHICTFLYIAKVAFREGIESEMTQSLSTSSSTQIQRAASAQRHKHVVTAVKIQWRGLLLAILSCGTVIFYWIFYLTQIHRLTDLEGDQSITTRWLQCMLLEDSNQNACVGIVSPHLPPFGLMITAEALVSLIGVWLFLIFGKRSLWREWNDMLYDLRVTLSGRDRFVKNGEQFYSL